MLKVYVYVKHVFKINIIIIMLFIDYGKEQKWLILDGPINNSWVENMSSAMDDNKILILSNGERILIPKQVIIINVLNYFIVT